MGFRFQRDKNPLRGHCRWHFAGGSLGRKLRVNLKWVSSELSKPSSSEVTNWGQSIQIPEPVEEHFSFKLPQRRKEKKRNLSTTFPESLF